jgi:hypothetical protein
VDASDGATGWHNVILPSEIIAAKIQTAYEAVARLRPRYLTMGRLDAAGGTAVPPAVVIDRGLPEPLDVLRGVPADVIAEIRFVEPYDAVTAFGAQYVGGVVVVRLVTRRPHRPNG